MYRGNFQRPFYTFYADVLEVSIYLSIYVSIYRLFILSVYILVCCPFSLSIVRSIVVFVYHSFSFCLSINLLIVLSVYMQGLQISVSIS